ncbi:MAG: lysoplasmalogenase, partial [Chloroflexota bacterium]
MYIFPILALAFAGLQGYATYNGLQRLQYLAKPAVMVCLLVWLYLATGLRGIALWFGIGVLFSLLGDVLLLWLDRFFVYGLAAFLLAHIAYIVGFREGFAAMSFWGFLLTAILWLSGVRLMKTIISSIREKGQGRLVWPVVLYGVIISVMLFAAMLTLSDLRWKPAASLLVAGGALLFFSSDIVLAWN